jgi:hypothetical protein
MKSINELVVQARTGDLEAFGQLERATQAMAYAAGWAVLRDAHLAQDSGVGRSRCESACSASETGCATRSKWQSNEVFDLKTCDPIFRPVSSSSSPARAQRLAGYYRGPWTTLTTA